MNEWITRLTIPALFGIVATVLWFLGLHTIVVGATVSALVSMAMLSVEKVLSTHESVKEIEKYVDTLEDYIDSEIAEAYGTIALQRNALIDNSDDDDEEDI